LSSKQCIVAPQKNWAKKTKKKNLPRALCRGPDLWPSAKNFKNKNKKSLPRPWIWALGKGPNTKKLLRALCRGPILALGKGLLCRGPSLGPSAKPIYKKKFGRKLVFKKSLPRAWSGALGKDLKKNLPNLCRGPNGWPSAKFDGKWPP